MYYRFVTHRVIYFCCFRSLWLKAYGNPRRKLYHVQPAGGPVGHSNLVRKLLFLNTYLASRELKSKELTRQLAVKSKHSY